MIAAALKKFRAKSAHSTVAASHSLAGEVYGRICTTGSGDTPPTWLANDHRRRAIFIFGPDAIELLASHETTYDALLALGFTREYLKFEVGTQTLLERQSL